MNPKSLPPHQPDSANPHHASPSEVAAAVPSGGKPSSRISSGKPSQSHANKNPEDKVFSLPESEIEDGSVEAGLLCLSYWVAENPGLTLSHAEIAHVCGCSVSLIATIEQRALRRIKRLHREILRDHEGEEDCPSKDPIVQGNDASFR